MRTWRACRSIFRIRLAEGLQYRMAGFLGAFTNIFWALVEITVYIVFYTYAANKSAGLIAGLSLRQIITYSWLGQLLYGMQSGVDDGILKKIVSGDVGIELCRPMDLYTHWFAEAASGRLARILWRSGFILLAGAVMPFGYGLSAPASLSSLLFALVSTVTAFFLCAAFGMLVTAVRLNITWGEGPTYLLTLVSGILSGGYLPLQLWPPFLQRFLLLQPFAGYLDLPIRLYIGAVRPGDAPLILGVQLFWIAVFIILGRRLMKKRLEKMIVQGG